MVTKDRKIEARRRARELQKEESERLARMQSARTDGFIALEAIDEATEALGYALDRLLDEGESKKKLATDFSIPTRQINEALEVVGSAHARKTESDKDPKHDDADVVVEEQETDKDEVLAEKRDEVDGDSAADDS
ncbi:hypothetical protein ACQX0Q_02635 [Corynebacterium diphtheriae]